MKRGWQALMALVLFASAVPLAQVLYDRSSPPRTTMTFTQRELMSGWNRDENTVQMLNWSWSNPPELDSVPDDRLESLGLRCVRGEADCYLAKGRRAWVVVGLGSGRYDLQIDTLSARIDSLRAAASDSTAARQLVMLEEQLKQLRSSNSRLTMVDVGTDRDALAERWPDGTHLILAARITAYRQSYLRDSLPGQVHWYRVNADPLPMNLYVPTEFAHLVRDSTGMGQQRYQVEVAIGRRWLPRVVRVTRE